MSKRSADQPGLFDDPDLFSAPAPIRRIVSIKGKYYTTATERKAIRAGIEAGYTKWKTARKQFEIVSDNGAMAIVRVTDREIDEYGRERLRTQDHVVTFST